jgi:hypothetical protein
MNWLEIIKLQSVGNRLGLMDKLALIRDEVGRNGLVKFEFYRHTLLETDLSVHLQWDTEKAERQGSTLGLHLVQALEEYGLVDHSIWIEKEK